MGPRVNPSQVIFVIYIIAYFQQNEKKTSLIQKIPEQQCSGIFGTPTRIRTGDAPLGGGYYIQLNYGST